MTIELALIMTLLAYQVDDTHEDVQGQSAVHGGYVIVDNPAMNDRHDASQTQTRKQTGSEHSIVLGLKRVVHGHHHSPYACRQHAAYCAQTTLSCDTECLGSCDVRQ